MMHLRANGGPSIKGWMQLPRAAGMILDCRARQEVHEALDEYTGWFFQAFWSLRLSVASSSK